MLHARVIANSKEDKKITIANVNDVKDILKIGYKNLDIFKYKTSKEK